MATYIWSTAISNAYIGIPSPESITLDKSSITLTTIWQTEQLTATIEPTISDHSITWSSDDTTVATVSTTGLVTCVTPWECTITATTVNGLTASCSVNDNQSWQPWINTVLYMPLDWDVVDYSSYNRSFTVYGSTASVGSPVFDTLASWKKVANFIATDSHSSNWIAFTDNVTDIPSSWNMTVSSWINRSSNWSRYMGIVDYRGNSRYTWMTWIHQNNRFLFHGVSQETSDFIPTVWTWYNMICTVDNGTCYIYKDGVQIYSDSYTYNSPSQKVCLWCFYNSWATNAREESFNWKLWDVIVENKARTAQEIADYYDLTKSLYGIS